MNWYSPSDATRVKLAWAFWAFFFVLAASAAVSGHRDVSVSYRAAAERWMTGGPLYDDSGAGFIYLPHSAILYVPFALLPQAAASVLWRACTMGLFAAGVWQVSRLARREFGRELFPYMTLVAVPLSWSSARNGQSTLAIAGLTMLAAHALAHARWNRAAFMLTLGLALKPLIVVPMLLAGAMYRPMIMRLVAGVAVLFAAGFACQSPSYVWSQYADVPRMLSIASVKGQEIYWAEVFVLPLILGYETPEAFKFAVRIVAAGITLAACLWACRAYSPARAAIVFYTLSAGYLMLMNPRTENNTYSFIAPAVGLAWAHGWIALGSFRRGMYLFTCAVGILSSFELGRLFTPRDQSVWLAPICCAAFLAYYSWHMVHDRTTLSGAVGGTSLAPGASNADGPVRPRRVA